MSETDLPDSDPPGDDARTAPTYKSRCAKTNSPHERRGIRRYLAAMLVALIGPNEQFDEQPAEYDNDQQAAEAFVKKRQGLIDQRAGLRLWRIVLFAGVSTLPFLILIYVWCSGDGFDALGWSVYVFGFLEALWLLSTLVVRAMVRGLNVQIDALEYERAVRRYVTPDERTAANLFFRHQNEVKTYYDQILRQNSQVFWLGIVCVVIGLTIVGGLAAGMLFGSPSMKLGVQIVSGALGAVAAGLTGVVARVYLTVHNNSADSIGRFHERLVATNHYHLANLIITSIDNKRKQRSAMADLAHAIASSSSFEGESTARGEGQRSV